MNNIFKLTNGVKKQLHLITLNEIRKIYFVKYKYYKTHQNLFNSFK